ncbi:MAG TPA: Stk1 family PASTA domain-containing Ser/Thr kinase, partial [Rubrobacteraceae bacterium]|nr:Stk1 family PASTA domain-containing Ser/Thr kinase [Rubrobacteraceae bacterium]
MADVYLAHDEVLDRDVALKILSRRYAEDDGSVERFRREAKSAASLSHPNIIYTYDQGETDDGTYYIVMEYLPGGTLKERILRKGPLPPQTAVAVAIQIAEALEEAHRYGVIHRDIKPQNILITDSGDVKVADFGIARAASSSTVTETGWIMGSAHYISPEQAMGEPVSPRSDLYSLGIVLYEMLTGTLPYDAENPIGIAIKHVDGPLCPPREVDPSIPEGINAVTVQLLAKDPKDRYQNAASLLEDLYRIEKGLTPAAATTQKILTGAATTRAMGDERLATTQANRIEAPSPLPHPEGRQRRKIFPRVLLLVMAAALLAALALIGTVGSSLWQNFLGNDTPVLEVPSLVKVPDVRGQSLEEASGALQDAGLTVDQEYDTAESSEPKGTVLSTDPPAGSEVEEGTSVALTVSSGTPKARTTELNTPADNGTPKRTATEFNTQQPDLTPVSSPDPAPVAAPQQPAPKQSAQDGEQVLEDWGKAQEEDQEEAQKEVGKALEGAR